MLERLDKVLVDQGHAKSRTQAQKLIEAGAVQAEVHGQWLAMTRAAQKIPVDTRLKTGELAELRYVSRAGLKLDLALRHICATIFPPNADLALHLGDVSVLDIGQSTGGFTDCLLQYPVRLVVGVDVGRDQLAEKLRNNLRVVCLEGINAREMSAANLHAYSPDGFDWVVMDVSFISQTLILPNIPRLMKNRGYLLSLVKPQFEVGAKNLTKGGIVRDASLYEQVRIKVTECATLLGLNLVAYFGSGITGGDGNREFFMLCQKP
jgi:23S rRNA (cytidine1920-2'-O)/16S rRNA (cytidine1409-2'-O)-methyltransferase